MRTQEILTRVNEAISLIDSNASPRNALDSLARDLEGQLRSEIANSKGVGNALKTVTAILDANKDGRVGLSYPWTDAEGRQCVCNGYVLFRLREHLPLPERPADIPDAPDVAKLIPTDLSGYKTLPMPSAKELRAFIAVERAKCGRRRNDFKPLWSFGEGAPKVNALYLLDAATIFPNAAELFWQTVVSPLYITCDEGDGIVLPVRVFEDTPEKRAQHEADEAAQRKAEEERREIISKAGDDYKAARKDANDAQAAKNAAKIKAEKAKDNRTKSQAMQAYYKHAEAEGKARLRMYAASMIAIEDFDIEPGQFEYLVRLLHVRELAA